MAARSVRVSRDRPSDRAWHTTAEIAAKLHLSRRTVERHRARTLHKRELKTRAGLVRFALDRRLIGR